MNLSILIWQQIIGDERTNAIFCNEDYEDEAVKRDQKIKELIEESGDLFTRIKTRFSLPIAKCVKQMEKTISFLLPTKKLGSRKWKVKVFRIILVKV